MSNISSSALHSHDFVDNTTFEEAKLKRTTVLTGNHHGFNKEMKKPMLEGRQRTMSEADQIQGLKSMQLKYVVKG